MRIIPTVNNGVKETFPTLPSDQLRYYVDILEEAACAEEAEEQDPTKLPEIDEIKHSGKGGYTEYKG